MSREFWKYFLSAVGSISSVITLISFVFELQNPTFSIILAYILIILVISSIYAFVMSSRKKSLSIKISNNTTVNVIAGNIFEYSEGKNFIVIPFNEYFDTIVDEKIISSSSIHGQFINEYYKFNHNELHNEIESYFNLNKIEGVEVERPNSRGYKIKYPIGTCVKLSKGTTTFILVAFTHFDENDHAYIELSELGLCISRLCKFVSSVSGKTPLYMPLMGMGLSRLNQTGQFILKYTLDTIVGMRNLTILGGLNIIVYPTVAKTLNLNEIKY